MPNLKVGILTYHHSYNFGANLQTLATQSMLRRRGVDAIVINFQDPKKVAAFKGIVSQEQASQHEAFFAEYYTQSPLFTRSEQIEEFCRGELDGVIVGSDAVFRLIAKYSPRRVVKRLLRRDSQYASFSQSEFLPPYWLNWDGKTKNTSFVKVSLAASSRSTPFLFLKPSLMSDVKTAINDFDYVTVRDEWTQKMLRFLTFGRQSVDICHDPVFGLNSAFELPGRFATMPDLARTILVSVDVSPQWRKEFVAEAHKRGYQVKLLPNAEDYFPYPESDGEVALPMSPLAWYGHLANAAGYVGFRFHALVSCLANQTPVVTVDTGQTVFKGPDKKSPCFFTCKEANAMDRYFTKLKIRQLAPATILDRLFDSKTHASCNAFAARASDQVNHAIDSTLSLLGHVHGTA